MSPRAARWRAFVLLLILSLLGSLSSMPLQWQILKQSPQTIPLPDVVMVVALAVGALFELMLTAAALGIGLWLGGGIGLGAPILEASLAGDALSRRRLRTSLPLAVGIGVLAGAAIAGLALLAKPLIPAAKQQFGGAAWMMILVSFGAGVREEIWFRLGLMTFLAWLGATLLRQRQANPGVVWAGNVLATLLFGAAHLPLQAAVTGLTVPIVLIGLTLNGVAGVVFGWLYWRRGLVAAMVAHFSTDIVLHVVVPAVARLMNSAG